MLCNVERFDNIERLLEKDCKINKFESENGKIKGQMDISRFELACERLFDLGNLQLSRSYHYNSIACCIVDAVYSIGVRYQSTENTVASFCKYAGIERYRKAGSNYDAYTVSRLMQIIRTVGTENSADVIFHNRQRTSSRNGILKSEAVLRFAEILSKCGIETFADFQKNGVPEKYENEIKRIPGQKSGLALHYFYMLAGNDDYCKPDRHILKFLSHYLGIPIDVASAQKILERAVREMKTNYPNLTVRSLDYAIWNYAKDHKQLADILGMKQYDKLVRDRIPEIIEQSGKSCMTAILSDEEYLKKIDDKLDEELTEYHKDQSIEELADLLEVIYAAAKARGYSLEELEQIRAAKAEKRGAFDHKILLIDVKEN